MNVLTKGNRMMNITDKKKFCFLVYRKLKQPEKQIISPFKTLNGKKTNNPILLHKVIYAKVRCK